MTSTTYPLGAFVCVKFGTYGTQLARVEGFTKTGRYKVRAYNAGREEWYPSLRTVKEEEIVSSWVKPLPDLSKAFRVYLKDEEGNYLYEERTDGRMISKISWKPLHEIVS